MKCSCQEPGLNCPLNPSNYRQALAVFLIHFLFSLCMFFSVCSGADTDFWNQLCLGEFCQDQYFWLSAGLPKHPQ